MLLVSLGSAQVFDNQVNFSASTSQLWYDQQCVLYDNNGDVYYHLTNIYGSQGAALTCIDPNGNVLWSKHIQVGGTLPQFYGSMCFNQAQTAIALVGTVYYPGSRKLAVVEVDLSGSVLNQAVYKPSSALIEGVAIRTYGSEYVVGGNYKTCAQGCDYMFLARIASGTLTLGLNGYFAEVGGSQHEIFRDLHIKGNEATVIAMRNNIEVMCLHFDVSSFNFLQNYGAGTNVKGLLYREILEMPPHLAYDETGQGDFVYIGAGISTQQGAINVLMSKVNSGSFNTVWSKQYADLVGSNSNQVWSPGRLALNGARVTSAFRTANTGILDNGVLRVLKSTGALIAAVSYNGWSQASLYDVTSVLGSQTFMTGEFFGGMRYFDGNGAGNNNIGCGKYSRVLTESDAVIIPQLYEYDHSDCLSQDVEVASSVTINGSFSDCAGNAIGSFKRDLSAGINNAINSDFEVYPNPTSGLVNIELNEGISTIQLVNHLGQVLETISATSESLTLDLSGYPKGMYFIKTDDSKATQVAKINKL